MSERDMDRNDEVVSGIEHDPDKGSTWNTFDHTANIEDLLAEQEIEDLMAEIPQGELSVISDTDIPGEPG